MLRLNIGKLTMQIVFIEMYINKVFITNTKMNLKLNQ